MTMGKPIFDCYQFDKEPDVVFVGLKHWIILPDRYEPLLGTYLANESEVDQFFDSLFDDLNAAKTRTKNALRIMNRRPRGGT